MSHYVFVSFLISIGVLCAGTGLGFFAGLVIGEHGAVGGEAMGAGAMLAILFAMIGLCVAVTIITVNYVWGGWW